MCERRAIVTADLITHQESYTFDTTYEYIYDTSFRINSDINKKDTVFLLNNLIELNIDKDKKEKECYYDSLCDLNLINLLKTIPAIDELQICDSTDFIKTMDIKATFHGNSVESFLKFTTSHGDTVTVKFLGSY